MTDTVCLVKPHLGMFCLHWRNLPWTKQITTTKIKVVRMQGTRDWEVLFFTFFFLLLLLFPLQGPWVNWGGGALGNSIALNIGSRLNIPGMNIALLKTVLFLVLEPA